MKQRFIVLIGVLFIGIFTVRQAWTGGANPDLTTIFLKYGALNTAVQSSLPIPPALAVPSDPLPSGERVYLVQFSGPIQSTWRAGLDQAVNNIVWGEYLANFAFLARMTPTTATAVELETNIQAVVDMHPAYRIDGALLTADGSGVDSSLPSRSLIVTAFTTIDHVSIEALVISLGGTIENSAYSPSLTMYIDLPTGRILSLAQSSYVTYIEPLYPIITTNADTRWIAQTNVVDYTPVYSAGFHGEGQIVAVDEGPSAFLNTGDEAHCQFSRPGHVEFLIDTPSDCTLSDVSCFHATHVLSALGGDQGEPDGGVYGEPDNFDGIAPAANLILQVGFPAIYPSARAAYSETAYIQNRSIVPGVVGENAGQYKAPAYNADRFMWDFPDFLFVVSAGNLDGTDEQRVINPGTAKNVITVGGSEPFPEQEDRLLNEMGGGSRIGPMEDGRIKPTVMLTGFPFVARKAATATCGVVPQFGTSFASPAVAGTAALVRQYLQEVHGIVNPAASLIKAIIVNSGRNMVGADTLGPIPSNGQGWGRVTLNDTLHLGEAPGQLLLEYNETGLTTGEEVVYTIEIDDPVSWESLKATLVWTDYPGSTGGGVVIVNDLDLRVVAPDGTVYYGNVFSSGHSITGGSIDRRNVEEQVFLLDEAGQLPVGTYQIIVSAYNVPLGP